MKSLLAIFAAATVMLSVSAAPHGRRGGGGVPPPHHHHHHHGGHHHHRHSKAWGIGAGILGAGLIASTIYNATHPTPVVVAQPTVVTPAPVVVTPAPVVVQQPVATGHYETRVQNVWVEGRYIDQQTPQGATVRTWQPGHYEQQQTQVWVTP